MRYLQECRSKLRGFVPASAIKARGLEPPKRKTFARFTFEAENREMSTMVAFLRMLSCMLKDSSIG
jgi:pyruvate dehydrogenase E1 component